MLLIVSTECLCLSAHHDLTPAVFRLSVVVKDYHHILPLKGVESADKP